MESIKLKTNKKIYVLSTIILSVVLLTFMVLYFISLDNQNKLKIQLENMYQQNFNELVDNINNTDIKLSKVLASNYGTFAEKMLNEISQNTAQASNNLASLPVSINGVDETIEFINKISGYTQTMSTKLEKKENLTVKEIETLEEIKNSLTELKNNINKISLEIYNGNIFNESKKINGDYNNFTIKLKNVKSENIDYPTMIYDGPFSDSTLNKKIKNLTKNKISKNIAEKYLIKIFNNIKFEKISYLGETNGKFKTYDFELIINKNKSMYAQISQNEGKLLTLSCNDDNENKNYTINQAKDIAIIFANKTGIKNVECVWSYLSENDAYINLAPVENGVICYPDLIKLKVDLGLGQITGFEASSYYTNNTNRVFDLKNISINNALKVVPKQLKVIKTKLCLAPIEYNREVLCYEVTGTKDGDIFYVYINVENNEIENILKMIENDNGTLMI